MTQLHTDAPPIAELPVRDLESLPKVSLVPGIFRKSPFFFLSEAAREHGGFVRLNIGPKSVYLVSDPRLFQHMLRDNVRNYQKSKFLYNAAKPMVGEGLLTSEGDFWLRQRRMIQPQFHRQRIATFAHMMSDAVNDVMAVWEADDRMGGEVDLGERMAQLTVEIVSRTLFGTATLSPEDIAHLGKDMMAASNYVALRGYMPFIPHSIPVPGARRFEQAMIHLTQAVNAIIKAGEADKGDGDNLITMLLHTIDEETNERMTHKQLFDEVMTAFSAGFETTATAMTWIWFLLAQNPDVEQKMRDEVASVVGDRPPTLDDITKLVYCRQALQESMRFYPPIPMLPRTALADDVMDGYHIPQGTILLLFYHGLHHNAEYWDAPENFDPDRFTPHQSEKQHRFAYLPFSAGPRKCIGNEFAMMEGTLVLAMLLQRYRISLVEGQTVVPNLSATLKPSPGIQVKMERIER